MEGEDHGLDFNGGLEASLRDLQTVVTDLVEFFDEPDVEGQVQAA